MSNPYRQYQKTAVTTASREKILLMLYEGCIRFMKQALNALDNKDIAGRGMNIGRAFDIVNELNNTLNHEIGGDIAKNLEQLYIFVNDQLTKANAKGDRAALVDAIKIMETLYDGWVQAVEKIKKEELNK